MYILLYLKYNIISTFKKLYVSLLMTQTKQKDRRNTRV